MAIEDTSGGVARDAADRYLSRGWSVIPIPYRTKKAVGKKWPQMRLTHETLDQHFNGQPQNVGVLLGEPSGWLIDIDLDHPRAVELAPQFLPETPLVFGRPGKPRSHWLYRATAPMATKKFPSKSSGMIVEFRSTGAQTVFPPSIHESGEPITWEDESQQPSSVNPDLLMESVKRLAQTVLVELGEKHSDRSRKKLPTADQQEQATTPAKATTEDRAARCLAALIPIRIVDQRDGSRRLFAAACRAVEHDLDDATAVALIRTYDRHRPFRKRWSDAEVLRRIRDAEGRCQRGAALELADDGCILLGNREPESGKLVLSPTRTLPTAASFAREFHLHPQGRTIHCYAGQLVEWRDNRYSEMEDNAVKQTLQAWLHDSLRYVVNRSTGQLELVDFQSNPSTVKAALESIKSFVHLPATTPCPSWLDVQQPPVPPSEIAACRSVLLHLPTMRRFPPTPQFFSTCALDFDPDPAAPSPSAWLSFLHQLFGSDLESHELLQEWFGYCLTGDTSQQKMLLMVGPRRSGKGTIARVLTRLVGTANVCGPTTSSLAGPFGLQPLIGKGLAIVSDARFHGENIASVVERLLCISGEDTLTIDRKNIASVTLKLPTRFMFLTNEFPRLADSSGALAGRFVILRLTESYYGREDIQLTQRLQEELPGILNWAIEGWQRLNKRGHFIVPASVQSVVEEIEDLSSPVAAFVRDQCIVGVGHRVPADTLYEAWKLWCELEGRQAVTTRQTFGRDLAAAVAGVTRRRGTGMRPFYEGIGLAEGAAW